MIEIKLINILLLTIPYIAYIIYPNISPFVFVFAMIPFINNYINKKSLLKYDVIFIILADTILCIIYPMYVYHIILAVIYFYASIVIIIKMIDSKNVKLVHQMEEDFLTGVYNRRYFDDIIENEISRHMKNNAPLSMMMLDIDKFKYCNDSCGHQIGDEILKQIAIILKESVRSSDIVARYGGEEFSIILPGSNIQDAEMVANRIQNKLKDYVFNTKNPKAICGLCKKTVSIGIATIDNNINSAYKLINASDSALYEAKKTRNTIIIYKY